MLSPSLRDRRILIVEDEYMLAIELRRELRAYGCKVVGPVPSIDLALEIITSSPGLDAAVLDVNLQGEMSYPVADMLIEHEVPFVFATGYVNADLGTRYPQIMRCDKPFEFRKLERALLAILVA